MSKVQLAQKAAVNAARFFKDPLETLASQVTKPFADEFGQELGSFLGTPKILNPKPKSLAHNELERARQEKALETKKDEDFKKSREVYANIQQEYRTYRAKNTRENEQLTQEYVSMQEKITQLSKTVGIDTKTHLQNPSKKIGKIDISFLTKIIQFLTIKAEESKSAKELVVQRQNAKPATGMLAWVSGKQMKVHEQGTLQLQG